MSPPEPRTAFDRDAARARLAAEEFDLLVIGGGVTGAGVALDAAARGLRTALVEANDFASGTSSKSSKLIHGGLRYLQQKEYLLVYENLAERQRLLDNAPHLVAPLPFLIPIFGKPGAVNAAVAKAYNTALWLYDLTGGLRIGKRHRRVKPAEILELVPALRPDRIAAGFLYYDARADDARLTLELIRTAVLDHGAVAANYSPVASITKDGSGRVSGAVLDDGTAIGARVVVNAGGVWADDVRALDEDTHPDTLRPAKGIHISVPYDKLPTTIAGVMPVPKDKRSIFVIPWGNRVYLGTTDTDYDGPIDDPQCTADDVTYILDAVNLFVTEPLTASDVVGTWAGLRPLVKAAGSERTADLSRRHTTLTSPSGLVTITGGKLTTYRKMAADAVDAAVDVVGRQSAWKRKSPTKKLRLRGAANPDKLVADGIPDHLARRHGTEARIVMAMIDADAALGEPIVEGLPYLRAEVVYAVRYEMARSVADVLARRTRALLLDRDAAEAAASSVGALMAADLGWSATERAAQVAAFTAICGRERDAEHRARGVDV